MKSSKHARPKWLPYKVGRPSIRANWTNPDCTPLETVYHISHIDPAFRIFEDGRIRSSLVWDESKLRNTRTCVSWVSSNLWLNGSIYGNIRFDFDWAKLVSGRHFYWVEAITRYNPPAYRILISEADYSDSGLELYDPRKGDGPLFYDAERNAWYRNGDFTGEFLIDEDLRLTACQKATFENHNPFCRTLGCPHRSKRGVEAGAELIARLVSHNIQKWLTLFLNTASNRKRLHDEAVRAWLHLRKSFKVEKGAGGKFAHDHRAAHVLASAILDRYGWNRPKGQAKLCNLFASTEELRLALANRMVRAFGLRSAEALEGELE